MINNHKLEASMDSVVSSAIEEICAEGAGGVNLHRLWSLLQSSLAAHGLPLCPGVKAAVWSNLLIFPGLQFHVQGSPFSPQDSAIQSVENCEEIDLKIVASQRMRDDFLGLYDVDVSCSGVSDIQRCLLERLAIARHNGITQNQLAKELKIKGNEIFYKLKKLETRGLIVRQSTVVKTKEVCGEGEYKNSNVATNMVYLYRYAKHLGYGQRIEIVRKDKAVDNGDAADKNDDVLCQEHIAEEVQVKDFLPALEAVCEKLEKAPGKVLVVSDIKKDLGYRGASGHRIWRRIYGKLKAAQLVEDCDTKQRDKAVKCLRLLKKFSQKHFEPNLYAQKNDNPESEQLKSGKRAQITDQLLELPIEHQIYDMIDVEGCRGLTIVEICNRLGLPTKKIHDCLYDMEARYGLHLQAESKNRGKAYRVWTSGNYSSEVPDLVSCSLETMSHGITESDPSPVVWNADNVSLPIHDVDVTTSKDVKSVDSALMEEEASFGSVAEGDENLMLHPLITVDDASTKPHMGNTTTDTVQPETSLALSLPSKRRHQSHKKYPCLTLNATIALREQRILKMLEEEKILIKPELHRRLETLENLEKEKNSIMDRKTLQRNLDKLKQEGRCKLIMLTIPAITNCGRNRSTEVVLHPSFSNISPEVLGQIHEKLRNFEIQSRRQARSRAKAISGPLLDNVERISANVQLKNLAEQSEVRCANGFVLAKMVRTKLLHIFLWSHTSSSPYQDDLLSTGKYGCNMKNPHSTSKLFGLDAAIKAMPLELFLQVVGSTQKIEDMVDKCKNGLRLADLKVQEYRFLMDTGATARLSRLIDILLRLKLVRLVRTGHANDEEKVGDTTLRHAIELKPYIEEPVSVVPSSFGFIFPDLRPHTRHDFILSSRKAVDEYWSTLEYCYAAANSKAALHAFPGSAVHEIFIPRSWASARVMTADQRAQLLKRLARNQPHKKLSLNECREISRDLNLTLEQVVRIYYHKRRQCSILSEDSVIALPKHERQSSRKRRRSIGGNSSKDVNFASEGGTLSDHQLTDRQRSFLKTLGDHETSLLQDLAGDQLQGAEEQESNEESEDDQFLIHDCTLSTLKPGRKRRFSWTEEAERQLVIEYVRHRASVGAKFNRTDWTSLTNLPASPEVCRRRMAALNGNLQFRKAVMRLCNLLAERYTKELEKFQKHLENFESTGVLARKPKMQVNRDQSVDHNFEHNVELESQDCWDDFEDSDIKMVLDNALRLIRETKNSSSLVGSDEWFGGHEIHGVEGAPSVQLSPGDEFVGHRSKLPARRSRSRRIARKFNRLLNEGTRISRRVYESVAVSNAAELFKLIFLSTSINPKASQLLAETLRRYSQHDLFAAFSYLRENKIVIGGEGTSQFALSQDFLQSLSLSPFPTNTGKRALRFASWLAERERDLMEGEVYLPIDMQCGDIFHLCALISNMELSIAPCLPEVGIGEVEDSRASKRLMDGNEFYDGEKSKRVRTSTASEGEIISRREKGFPGIRLSLSLAVVPRVHTLDMFKDNDNSGASLFLEKCQDNSTGLRVRSESSCSDICNSAGVMVDNLLINQTSAPAHQSPWEDMTSYAEHLMSSMSKERSSVFHSQLFRTICLAIQESGDQGLSYTEFSKVLNLSGQKESEIVMDVLEVFGRAFKVSAYDSIHVVDTLYRSKYFLASVAEADQIPETNPPVHSQGKMDCGDDVSNFQNEMRTDSDDVHRVTILNRPEELISPLSGTKTSTEGIGCTNSGLPSNENPTVKSVEFQAYDSHVSRPLLAWINGDGTINELVYKGLVRRILGIVMQNPGILEDDIIRQMKALNPQSCRKLLEKLILDKHIIVRKMHQASRAQPPPILVSILGSCSKKPKLIAREHLFANPLCTAFL